MSDAVTFVHLTDLHAVAAPEAGDDACLGNLDRLAAVMTTIGAIAPRPDFVVVSGDITDRGDLDSYRRVRAVVEAHGLKTLYALGNHDSRPGFYAGMLDDPAGATVPYCHERLIGGLHVVTLDTSVAGKVAGALGADQFAFLDAALRRHPEAAKLLVMHHAPLVAPGTGYGWESLGAAGTQRLAEAIAGHPVAGIVTGHVHYDRVAIWNGVPVVTTTGLHNANDVLYRDGLRFVAGGSFALCTVRDGALSVAFVPLASDRRELAILDAATVRGFS